MLVNELLLECIKFELTLTGQHYGWAIDPVFGGITGGSGLAILGVGTPSPGLDSIK
jgi:hypothetical protein